MSEPSKIEYQFTGSATEVGRFDHAVIYRDAPARRWWQFWKPRARVVAFYDFTKGGRMIDKNTFKQSLDNRE